MNFSFIAPFIHKNAAQIAVHKRNKNNAIRQRINQLITNNSLIAITETHYGFYYFQPWLDNQGWDLRWLLLTKAKYKLRQKTDPSKPCGDPE